MRQVEENVLKNVVSKMLNKEIVKLTHNEQQLKGGTLGDVQLVTGVAVTTSQEELPYKVVWKKQDKWERTGDPESWRREYDLYNSELETAFSSAFGWPKCYHSSISEECTQLWMEFVDGVSGNNLTIEMLERVALELGRFQGRTNQQKEQYKKIACLGDSGFMERVFSMWHHQSFSYDFLVSDECRLPEFMKDMMKDGRIDVIEDKSFEYGLLRSKACDIPEHLKKMLMDIDDRREEIFARIQKLPIVLCHRDFWIENIFYSNGNIGLIDWDTSGWGYISEDIASLIVDDIGADRFMENYERLVPAYLKGLSEYMSAPAVEDLCIMETILITFGYRMVQQYMFSDEQEDKDESVEILQKYYDMCQKWMY